MSIARLQRPSGSAAARGRDVAVVTRPVAQPGSRPERQPGPVAACQPAPAPKTR